MKKPARISSWAAAAAFALVLAPPPAGAADYHYQAAGPVSLGYVGMYYGLVDPNTDSWYSGTGWLGGVSTTWHAIVDTGASAAILGKTTQDAYDAPGIPLEPYPDVKFTDEGFGGFVDFAVTKPVRLMIAGQAAAEGDTENHALYTAYGPIGGPMPPRITMAASLSVGSLGIDFDIIGMSVMEGRVLHVDPQHLEFLRLVLITMAGSLEDTPPPPGPGVLYVPVSMQDFFAGPQPVDVGRHAMLPMHLRHEAGDPYATRNAFFDSGSPLNFVCESFAVAAGIDPNATPDMTKPITGIGGGSVDRPGFYVDALALDLGAGRDGDRFVVSNTAVFVIPDESMPGGLDAILGNSPFAPSEWFVDTTIEDWYVDTRDPNDSYLILVLPHTTTPGDVNNDGNLDNLDITPFIGAQAAAGEAAFLAFYPAGDYWAADTNTDGNIDNLDITPFISIVSGGGGNVVPEPGVAVLLAMGSLAAIRRRRE